MTSGWGGIFAAMGLTFIAFEGYEIIAQTITIARQHAGEIVVVTVVEVPEGESLMTGRRAAREAEPLLDEAVELATARGMTARGVLKIAHRVSQGILGTAREEECNFLLLGRPVAKSPLERLVASIVERVIQDAPHQVGVVHGRITPERVRGVVVPVTSGANSQLAAELAPAFARHFEANIRALTVIPSDLPDGEAEALEARARKTLEEAKTDAELKVMRRREVGPGRLASRSPSPPASVRPAPSSKGSGT